MDTKYSANPAMFRNKPLGFILSVLLIPAGIGIIILLVWYLKCKATKLEMIGNDVVLVSGLLSKDRIEVDARSVRTVRVSQSFFNRLFGVGTISIYTAGDDPEIAVAGLPSPNDLAELIKAEQDA